MIGASVTTRRLPYRTPESIEAGNATELIQGAGGAAGFDYLYYFHFIPGIDVEAWTPGGS
jgi:hypothetical protein